MQKSLLAHMDKIQKEAKLGQMVKAIKQAKTVKHKKKLDKLAELTNSLLNYTLLNCVVSKRIFTFFQLISLILTLSH